MICMTMIEHNILHTRMILCCISWGGAYGFGGSVLKGFKPNLLVAQLQTTVLCRIWYYLECRDEWVDYIPTWCVGLDGDGV